MNEIESLSARTIEDFGEQWTRFQGNEGYYGSTTLLADICGPLLSFDDVRGCRAAEIGSGTGRIVRMLLDAGASQVIAIEPSDAFEVLQKNLEEHGDRVECIRATGEHLPQSRELDLVVSIGVLHHIPNPAPVVEAALGSLRPGGRMLVWLYGREGNERYLSVVEPLRRITTRLPHWPVAVLATMLTLLTVPYTWLCRRFPLPLRGYFVEVFGRMAFDKRALIIYDQLRPAFARYYTREEAASLLASAGFTDVRLHHRHGYSWTVIGTRRDA